MFHEWHLGGNKCSVALSQEGSRVRSHGSKMEGLPLRCSRRSMVELISQSSTYPCSLCSNNTQLARIWYCCYLGLCSRMVLRSPWRLSPYRKKLLLQVNFLDVELSPRETRVIFHLIWHFLEEWLQNSRLFWLNSVAFMGLVFCLRAELWSRLDRMIDPSPQARHAPAAFQLQRASRLQQGARCRT